ncbi:MAG: DnaJ domain-containing protein [Alphaproteobacteria bacterium]|nr:DnaJ domain-containing protein [Alphaproteobacteria bacterium]
MLFLLLGLATFVVLLAALGAFSRAQVATLKQFGLWVVAIGGLLLAAMLFLTGRGGIAIAALTLLAPMVWSWVQEGKRPRVRRPGVGAGAGTARGGAMSREEAFAVLGLHPGASAEEIRAAHRRLMRSAHPDQGGSDWLATRINQARDVLLG